MANLCLENQVFSLVNISNRGYFQEANFCAQKTEKKKTIMLIWRPVNLINLFEDILKLISFHSTSNK